MPTPMIAILLYGNHEEASRKLTTMLCLLHCNAAATCCKITTSYIKHSRKRTTPSKDAAYSCVCCTVLPKSLCHNPHRDWLPSRTMATSMQRVSRDSGFRFRLNLDKQVNLEPSNPGYFYVDILLEVDSLRKKTCHHSW